MKGIKRIEDLFDENGQVLPFPAFRRKYSLKKTSFLHYFQVISAIPGHLLAKPKSKDSGSKGVSHEDLESFCLAENVNINLLKAKSKDFYWLIMIHRRYNDQHSGPRRWNRTITEDKTNWKKIGRFEKYAGKTSYENSTLNSFTELLSQRRNCSDLTSNQIVIAFIAENQTP